MEPIYFSYSKVLEVISKEYPNQYCLIVVFNEDITDQDINLMELARILNIDLIDALRNGFILFTTKEVKELDNITKQLDQVGQELIPWYICKDGILLSEYT